MPRFTIDSISLISASSLNIHNDCCPICRNQLNEKCLECVNETPSNKSECNTSVGVCNHGYHTHCITTWLRNKKTCPLDNQRWEAQKHNINGNVNPEPEPEQTNNQSPVRRVVRRRNDVPQQQAVPQQPDVIQQPDVPQQPNVPQQQVAQVPTVLQQQINNNDVFEYQDDDEDDNNNDNNRNRNRNPIIVDDDSDDSDDSDDDNLNNDDEERD